MRTTWSATESTSRRVGADGRLARALPRDAASAGVDDFHAESERTTSHGPADPPHTDNAEHGVVQIVPEQEIGVPALPLTRSHHPGTLDEAATRREEQPDGGVGGGVGQDVWGVAD